LVTTDEITIAQVVYRYDFPAIDTYDLAFVDSNSISNIVNDTFGTLEVVDFNNPVSINNDVSVTGGLTCDTITLPIIGDLESAIQGKQSTIDTTTDLSCNSINLIDKYFYTLNSVVKPFGLYGETLHYYQVEDDLDTFMNSTDISQGDTILFPSGDISGNIVMGDVISVKFIGIREETTNFLGTMDIGVLQPDGNYLCRFENITFQGLVKISGGRKGHIYKNCSFEGGFTLSGSASSLDNPNIQFIDCIIRTLNVTSDYSTTNLGKALFRRCDFKGDPINALQNRVGQVVLDTCYRVADDHRTSTFNYELFGTTTLDIYHNSYSIAGTYYVDIDPSHLNPLIDRELTTKYYVDSEILTNTNA